MYKPRPKKPPPPPTVASVKDGITKLLRDVTRLITEVQDIKERLRNFESKNPLPPEPYIAGLEWHQRTKTSEPRSDFEATLWELESSPNLDPATRALFAMLTDLDGALRDIRKARLDIESISGDSDLRDEFKRWQGRS